MEEFEDQPALKRLRRMMASCSEPAAGSVDGENSPSREAHVRSTAEKIVKSLHACPSVEQAAHRCAAVLTDFDAEVRQSGLREAELRSADFEERSGEASASQSLQHTNRVLLKAVHHMAERCRRLEAGNSEVNSLRHALEQSQEAQRRLVHSNQVLQEHLKVHLNACHM